MKTFFICIVLFAAKDAIAKPECDKSALDNFKYLKTENGVEVYLDPSRSISVAYKCYAPTENIEQTIHQTSVHSKTHRISESAFYFDFDRNVVSTRTYFLFGENGVTQISFVADKKFKSKIDDTLAYFTRIAKK